MRPEVLYETLCLARQALATHRKKSITIVILFELSREAIVILLPGLLLARFPTFEDIPAMVSHDRMQS